MVLVLVIVVVVVVAAVAIANRRARRGLHRCTVWDAPTWRTGQEEFKVFMKETVPECDVFFRPLPSKGTKHNRP